MVRRLCDHVGMTEPVAVEADEQGRVRLLINGVVHIYRLGPHGHLSAVERDEETEAEAADTRAWADEMRRLGEAGLLEDDADKLREDLSRQLGKLGLRLVPVE
jgi:hypothetical protein